VNPELKHFFTHKSRNKSRKNNARQQKTNNRFPTIGQAAGIDDTGWLGLSGGR